jgi:hypothetical protein
MMGSRLIAAGAVTLLLVPGGAVEAQAPPRPVVEPARQLTTDLSPDRLYVSPAVAIDPTDPTRVVVAVADARRGGCGLLVSRDAGMTFSPAAQKSFMPAELPHCIQLNFGPAVQLAFAPEGQLYVATAGSSPAKGHPRGPVDALTIRTTDLGDTSQVSVVERGKEVTYKTAGGGTETGISSLGNNTVAVDTTNPSRIYRSFRFRTRGPDGQSSGQPDRGRISVSNDGGRTWAPSVDPLEQLGANVYGSDLPVLAAGPGGLVYGLARERLRPPAAGETASTRQRIFLSKSTDGGRTWSATVAFDDGRDLSDPAVAVDLRNGHIYVVFEHMVEGGLEHAFFMVSTDEGRTWSKPMNLVDDGGARHNQSVPGVSVAPNGRVDVAWYDFRNDPFFTPGGAVKQRWADVYGTSSTDHGRTWVPNYRVNDRSFDTRIGVTFDNEDVRGALGVASTTDMAVVTWADSRAGASPEFDVEDAYFTRVRFGPLSATDKGFDGGSALAGGAVGLALGGLVFLLVSRLGGRRAEAATPADGASGGTPR